MHRPQPSPTHRHLAIASVTLATGLLIFLATTHPVSARVLELANGMEISGNTARVPSIGADLLNPGAGNRGQLVVVVDDGLRRTFVSRYQVKNVREEDDRPEIIRLEQNPAIAGNKIGRVGALLRVTPFDEWGRRRFAIQAPDRQLNIVQGITEVTPLYTRLQGLQSAKPYVWDMRIATESIPRQQLRKVLTNHLDFDDADVRLSLVRMYIQAEQFGPAEEELNLAIEAFPDLEQMKQQLRELRQLKAKQQLEEIELRQASGQHRLAQTLLAKFPDEDIAGETLLTVSEAIEKYEAEIAEGKRILDSIQSKIDKIGNAVEKELYSEFHREISAEMNHNSLPRLAAYAGLADDEKMPSDQKLALALSGWVLNGNATENLSVAVSTWEVRKIVTEYLVSTDAAQREILLQRLQSEEAGAPRYVAQILAAIKPPRRTKGLNDRFQEPAEPDNEDIAEDANTTEKRESEQGSNRKTDAPEEGPEQATVKKEGYFVLNSPGMTADNEFTYHVQLPPEYDANRRYPTIVTLHAAGGSPETQIVWWAGTYNETLQMRLGQASRAGYIVIAPEWTKPKQRRYAYSAHEHAAVLSSLRDACQRFAVDTDRVFLSGHTMGGDAAWDISLAHPDLWAGVIPISAIAGYDGKASPNYISRYWENAKQVAYYFVSGALDKSKMDANSRDFNRYLQHTGYDVTIVEYLGRGHEHFHEELGRVFKWMDVHQRDPVPTEFTATIMRPWDNFFWWLELEGVPEGSTVLPAAWPPPGNLRPMEVKGSIRDKKNVVVTTGTKRARVFLTPDMVDLSETVSVYVNGKSRKVEIKAKSATILEDARRRGDRKHPFWVELDLPTGRAAR